MDDAEIGRLSLKSGDRSFTLKSGDSHLNWESWNLYNIHIWEILSRK